MHPRRGCAAVLVVQQPRAVVSKTATPRAAGAATRRGVYVHFPWCLAKCPYCDFLSVPTARNDIPHAGYAEAVLDELARRTELLEARAPSSVFFGGGTPSLWQPRELGRVLSAIAPRGATPELEVTVECNPSSLDERRAGELRDVGVNRLSIGVQSLDDERLRFLGRLHDRAGGLRAVRAATAARFESVSADLIFGVAGQTPEAAADEVRTIADLGVTHLSAYALTIEPGTQFGALAKQRRLPLLDEARVAESFTAVDEALTRAGFEHYEISNFARDGRRSRHNLGYWLGEEYLGLGTGAWGTVSVGERRVRYRNTQSPARYLDARATWRATDPFTSDPDGLVPIVEELAPNTLLSERILLGLRLAEGLDLTRAGAELGIEPWTAERTRAVDRMLARGRLVRDGDRLRIPTDRWLLADGTIAEVM